MAVAGDEHRIGQVARSRARHLAVERPAVHGFKEFDTLRRSLRRRDISRPEQRKASGKHVDSVIPSEGATGWADTTMMHIDAPHPNCAYMWMEHSINPKLQGDLAAWFGSVPSVLAA